MRPKGCMCQIRCAAAGMHLRQPRAGQALGEHVGERAELARVAVRAQQRQRLAPAVQRPRLHQACSRFQYDGLTMPGDSKKATSVTPLPPGIFK